jgi:periplasmic divalent cation tolerance protein
MADIIQIITTVDDRDKAEELGEYLVEERLAACCQIVGPISSTFHWKGRIEKAEEWYCIIKTKLSLYARAEEAIRSRHPYEVPEIIAIPVHAAFPGYALWVQNETV